MDCKQTILSRKSIRDFSSEPIPQEIIDDMILAAQYAPSCQNRQPWRFIFVDNPTAIKKLALHSGFIGKVNFFIKQAPLIVVACANPKNSCQLNEQSYYLVDVAIAFQQMILIAWQHGVGSCWQAAFNEKKVRDILNIPNQVKVVALSPFGFPKQKKSLYSKTVSQFAKSSKRLVKDKIVSFQKWNFKK
ncbi:MAG: nitroreductase family protein [Candidatus Cloacimonadota bacterium]|nr:nitroreductase family protein [Candidatus Cloacimonadota bacterium]